MDKEARNAYAREWYAKNKDRLRPLLNAKAADPEKRRAAAERSREWYEQNKEKAKARILAKHHAEKVLVGRLKDEAHKKWKGDGVGYHALHLWIKRKLGAPSKCEHCGTESARRFEWANVDHKYRRVLTDYMRLCTSCHRKHDYAKGIARHGGRRPSLKDGSGSGLST